MSIGPELAAYISSDFGKNQANDSQAIVDAYSDRIFKEILSLFGGKDASENRFFETVYAVKETNG